MPLSIAHSFLPGRVNMLRRITSDSEQTETILSVNMAAAQNFALVRSTFKRPAPADLLAARSNITVA